jgi:hypothetical protein
MTRRESPERAELRQLLERQETDRLARGAAAGSRLSDHQPAEYREPDGWAVGCTCGAHPGKRSARASTRCTWFTAHVKRLGLPRFVHMGDGNYLPAVYVHGPARGLTWKEAYARGIDINGSGDAP